MQAARNGEVLIAFLAEPSFMSADVRVSIAADANLRHAEFAVLVIPACVVDVCRDGAIGKVAANLRPSAQIALTKELRRTCRELGSSPILGWIKDHRHVTGLPITIQPWHGTADLNRTRRRPEWCDKLRSAIRLI